MCESDSRWKTPFARQCLVAVAVVLNMSSHGLVMGYAAGLHQLRRPDSRIRVNDELLSWLVAAVAVTLPIGSFILPSVMSTYGRKTTSLISIAPMVLSWIIMVLADGIPPLVTARLLQGFSMGLSGAAGPTLVAEYISPKYRECILVVITLSNAVSVLIVHSMGFFIGWHLNAMVCEFISLLTMLIVIFQPESPTWLAEQGRYEECKIVFRYLRGDSEDQELYDLIEEKILETKHKSQYSVKNIASDIAYFHTVLTKKEFYKPTIVIIHIYTLLQWSGANILVCYTVDVFEDIVYSVNISLMIFILDIQRIISTAAAMFFNKKVKRRTMLFVITAINVTAFLLTAAYVYFKEMLPIDHPVVGVVLIHLLTLSVSLLTPLSYTLVAELYPVQNRSLASNINVFFYSVNLFFCLKTVSSLDNRIDLPGAYCVYSAIVVYCLVVLGMIMPETKGRSRQDIAEEFRGRPLTSEELILFS